VAALEGYALASWWEDDLAAAIEARERAYALRREAGENLEAARLAGFLAWDYATQRGRRAIANGWLERARHLTEELPPSAEQAWLPLIEASFHLDTDQEAVKRLSAEAREHAKALGGLDVEMTARTLNGLALVSLGEVREGMRLLDEGVAAATSGELHDPIAIGSCCCNLVIACVRVRDYDRAAQWCDQLAGFCERSGQRPLLALCRAHHGAVQTARGSWDEAEDDLEWATGELTTLRPALAGYARTRFAELRRRQGRAAEAYELLSDADPHVLVPLVRAGLAADEGDLEAVVGHAERFMGGVGGSQSIENAAGLELTVPARAQLGDVDGARADHALLRTIADEVNTDPVRAGERLAAGALATVEGDLEGARSAVEDAIELYRRSGLPYEEARARLVLARVLATRGRRKPALESARSASAALDGLGAKRELAEAGRLVARIEGGKEAAAGLTPREIEVLAQLAQGLSNREIAERLVVSEHTVHRHVANIFAKLGVSSRAAAVSAATQLEVLG
jgi:DNA-binding CsgD family transcriptional regulator